MNSDEIAQRISEALAALGDSSDDVAAKLRELGIRGVREQADACPIHSYLRSCKIPVRAVTPLYIRDEIGRQEHWTPPPVAAFINAFDDGRYPDLVEAEKDKEPDS